MGIWKRIFNQTTLTGVGGWIFAILPLFQAEECSKMTITSVSLLVIGTILVFIGVFKKELSKKEWCNARTARLPYVDIIEKNIKEYRDITGIISKDNYLYDLKLYSEEKHPTFIKLLDQIGTDNRNYERLKANNKTGIKDIRLEIENTLGKIASKKFSKLVRGMYKREHIARSYEIFLKLYREQCEPIDEIEKRILSSKSIGAFEKYMGKIYKYITIMKEGDDIA
jgi:hypothetical protein